MKFQESTLSMKTFAELDLGPALDAALEKMGIKAPTRVQSQTLPVAVAGRDLITVAQTGSGKTLAFALPVLHGFNKKPSSRALVLVPSREMAMQIFGVFDQLCPEPLLHASLIIGGTPDKKQRSQLNKKPRLIIATPGRLNDHLRNNKLLLQNVDTVVIDEADRMLDLGFLPQLKDIKATMRGKWQTLLFSATFNTDVESVAKIFMGDDVTMLRSEHAEAPVATLKQEVLILTQAMKKDRLLEDLAAHPKGSVIVFTGSQESSEEVGALLREHRLSVEHMHGGLEQGHRARVFRDFRSGKARILVTTDLLARGLDVATVELVINYDMPFAPESFLHRIGRTARAGREGLALTYLTPGDREMYKQITPYLQGARETLVDPKMRLDKKRRY